MSMSSVIREFGVKVSLIFDKKTAEDINSSIGKITGGVKTLAVMGAGAAASMLELANIASTHSRALQQNSQALGINVERLQELQFAAKVAAGVSEDELTGALEGVSKTLFDARNNNVEAAQTLIRLGVPLKMISDKGVTADQVMMQLADRFKELPDGMYKTALANEAFGGSGAKLIPLLNKGAQGIANMGKEARQMGVVMSKSGVDKGAEFDRQLTKIWITLKHLTYILGTEFIKYLGPIVKEFEIFFKNNKKFIVSGIVEFVKSYAMYFKIVLNVLKMVNERFKAWIERLGGAQKVFDAVNNFLTLLTAVPITKALFAIGMGLMGLLVTIGLLATPFIMLGLVIYGFYKVIKGGIDIFNAFVDGIKSVFTILMSTGGPAKLFGMAIDSITEKTKPLIEAFQGVHGLIDKSTEAMGEFGNKVANTDIGKKVKSTFSGFKLGEKFDSAYQSVKQTVAPQVQAANSFFGQPATATAGAGGGGHTTNNMSANISVTVPRGTSPEDATHMVSKGTEKGFKKMMREVRDQKIGGVAY